MISDLHLENSVNVFDYIPRTVWSDILSYTGSMLVSMYLNLAHAAAANTTVGANGSGGRVYYPPGKYLADNIVFYSKQEIFGAGRSGTIIQQTTSANTVFAVFEWVHGSASAAPIGPYIHDIGFMADPSTTSNYAIIEYGSMGRLEGIESTGLPILLTSITSAGTSPSGSLQNIRIIDVGISKSINGGIVNDSMVTDTMVDFCSLNACGNDTLAAIDVFSFAGWHISNSKIFSCPNTMIKSSNNSLNLILSNNNFQFTCSSTTIGLTTFVGIVLFQPAGSGVLITGNVFRIEPTFVMGGNYTFLMLKDNSATASTLHAANRYFLAPITATGVVVNAFVLASAANATGITLGNVYDGFSSTQLGNGEATLQPGFNQPTFNSVNVLATAQPPAPSSGWQIYCDSAGGNKLKAKASNGTIVILGTP